MCSSTTAADQQMEMASERGRLLRLCAHLTGDRQAAEDLAQETLLIAWRQEHTLRDRDKRAQWRSGIARNLCLHWLRHRRVEWSQRAEPRSPDEGFAPRLQLQRRKHSAVTRRPPMAATPLR